MIGGISAKKMGLRTRRACDLVQPGYILIRKPELHRRCALLGMTHFGGPRDG